MQKLLLAAASLAVLSTPAAAQAPLDAARLTADVKVLSSDAFEGRAPASAGEEKTVAYLVQQMKAAGLQPAGDPLPGGGRAWTQDVPLARFTTKGPVKVGVTVNGRAEPWTQGEQVAIRAAQTGSQRLIVRDAPVVFAGYG